MEEEEESLLPPIIICYDYPGQNKAFYVRSVSSIPTAASAVIIASSEEDHHEMMVPRPMPLAAP